MFSSSPITLATTAVHPAPALAAEAAPARIDAAPADSAALSANATLDLVRGGLVDNAARVGEHFIARLRELQRDYPCIGDVRGKGLWIGMELVQDDAKKTPAAALCDAVVTRAFHNGLLLLSCGTSTVRFMPPLTVTVEEVDEAMAMLKASLDQALAGH